MTNPYEERNALPLTDVPVAVQGDKTTSCGSCRTKIDQATFDMTAGAFFPDTILQEVYPPQSREPLEFDNPIDELYGRKMPTYQENNPIDELYGGRIYPTGEPCVRNVDGSFLFDNKNLKKELFYGTNISDDCQLSLMYTPETKLPTFEHFLKVDLSDCCEALIKNIWCLSVKISNEKIKVRTINDIINVFYNKFIDCANAIIEIELNELLADMTIVKGLYGGRTIKYEIQSRKEDFEESINSAKDRLIDDYKLIKRLTDYDGERQDSCFCSEFNPMSKKLPVYCCYPDEDPDNCYCPDGSLKNLCEECKEVPFKNVTVELEMPLIWTHCYCWDCDPSYNSMVHHSIDMIYEIYDVLHPNELLYTSDPQHLVEQAMGEPKVENKFKMTLPTEFKAKVVCKFDAPCGVCCFLRHDDEDLDEFYYNDMDHRMNSIPYTFEIDLREFDTDVQIQDFMQNEFFKHELVANKRASFNCYRDC